MEVSGMPGHPTLLAVLLEEKGLLRYGSFCIAYEKAARSLDGKPGIAPSRAQFHRWLVGDLRSMPYTDHCRVLEHLITNYSASQLFAPCPDGVIPAPARRTPENRANTTAQPSLPLPHDAGMADVAAVFTTRTEFAASVQPSTLFDNAHRIRAAGLSLNLFCQQMPDQYVLRLLTAGTELTCLFLDPDGKAIKTREEEENYAPGHLSSLNKLNIDIMSRLRDRLPADSGNRLRLAVYDETIRFNIILVDDDICVAQPYMPTARGVDSPTLLIRRTMPPGGLYPVFEQVFESIAERSRPI
jgi:hypothetical protein